MQNCLSLHQRFWAFEGGHTTTPKGLGWLQLPPTAGMGLAEATPKPLGFVFLGVALGHWGGLTTPRPKMG
jgi:hypothetical protein